MYGHGSQENTCLWSTTTSKGCTEGFKVDEFDFYETEQELSDLSQGVYVDH